MGLCHSSKSKVLIQFPLEDLVEVDDQDHVESRPYTFRARTISSYSSSRTPVNIYVIERNEVVMKHHLEDDVDGVDEGLKEGIQSPHEFRQYVKTKGGVVAKAA